MRQPSIHLLHARLGLGLQELCNLKIPGTPLPTVASIAMWGGGLNILIPLCCTSCVSVFVEVYFEYVHALKACYEMCVFVVPPQSLPLFLRPPCRLGQARARRMHRCPVRYRIQWTHLRAQCGHRELMLSQPLLTGGHCSSGRRSFKHIPECFHMTIYCDVCIGAF